MFRKIAGAWLKFFLPGFHPWNEDDRHLLRAYEASAANVPAARQEGPPRGLGREGLVLVLRDASRRFSSSRISRAGASVPRAQLSRGATIPSGVKPSFSSTRPDAGLSRKCEPSRLGSPSARAMSIERGAGLRREAAAPEAALAIQ